ncbi:MAG: Rrf2 family transcriptional regulator [Christensenellaceae bacterium]|jgi:Rrf2 family protein|nr:Rrf2 family transcriptional regulator [Christensenellaceae bacterium]
MRISAKGRYALAATVFMAQQYPKKEPITVIFMSTALGISKIYLEQVFSLLKKAGLVRSVKGSQGGYQLNGEPAQLTAYDVLLGVEGALFEPASPAVAEFAPEIDRAILDAAFTPADAALKEALGAVTLERLALEAQRGQSPMYYI